ncbi:MAG: class I SAM-dependent methyltransferase [Steroidobacteraceae bacterium]
MSELKQAHWDSVYEKKSATEVSWYEAYPAKSLYLIRESGLQLTDPIIDVGGGASLLVDALLDAGYRNLTVLDLSAEALQRVRDRLGVRARLVHLLSRDVTTFLPDRAYALLHDRAVFHFLTQREDRERYVKVLRQALRPNGYAIIATFGPNGPERCSGLSVARYDADSLAAELGDGFILVETSLEVHRTPWDAEQQFLYCRFRRQG